VFTQTLTRAVALKTPIEDAGTDSSAHAHPDFLVPQDMHACAPRQRAVPGISSAIRGGLAPDSNDFAVRNCETTDESGVPEKKQCALKAFLDCRLCWGMNLQADHARRARRRKPQDVGKIRIERDEDSATLNRRSSYPVVRLTA